MRLVHLADLHLGFRQYQRLTPSGINQREADVAGTFRRAVDEIIRLRPELILVAGDVFHSSRPTNAAILHAFRQFLRIRNELPETEIVVVAGDHDTPRTTESGSIMGLFEQIGIHVASHEPRSFLLEHLDVAVLGVPDVPGPRPAFVPDPRASRNILLIHANVTDVVPQYYADLDRSTTVVSRPDLELERWNYVALGHYHVHQKVAANAYYSGSLDFTSLNVWYDLSEQGKKGKGFIEYDLDKDKYTFHSIGPSREFLELDAINARDMSPAEVNAFIARAVERVKGGIEDKVVRLIVRDIPRQVSRELDHRMLRELKRRALSFVLDLRKPEAVRRDASGAPARRPSVADVVREQLRERPIPHDLDRDRLVDLGMQYLSEADAFPAPAVSAPEVEA